MEIDIIKEYYSYNPKTGDLMVIKRDGFSAAKLNKTIECFDVGGYRRTQFRGKTYKAHIICWALYYGEFPTKSIDHIDGDPANNKIDNLRLATRRENAQNRIESRKGKLCGAYKVKNGYVCRFTYNKQPVYGGQFKTEIEAHQEYLRRLKLYGSFD